MKQVFRRAPGSLAVLVVGTDTMLEALPARPIQLAHACGALGFDLVVPLSWGDELVAQATLAALKTRSSAPAILCVCPVVRQRLLGAGKELADSTVSVASPPTAVARYFTTILGDRLGSLSFVGLCPSARADYDFVFEPLELLAMLRSAGVEIAVQPDVFTDRVPPDRRRHLSLPGGCPAPDVLWHACNERVLVELEGGDLPIELAQHLIAPRSVLVDVATAVGCACSGVTHATTGRAARIAVGSLEPPRSATPVFAESVALELDVPITASDRSSAKAVGSMGYAGSGGGKRAPLAVTPEGVVRVREPK